MNVMMMKTVRTHILTSFINVTLFGSRFDALSAFWLLLVHNVIMAVDKNDATITASAEY